MDKVINVDMSLSSLAVLISGLYTYSTGIAIEAVPSSLYIEIAEKLYDCEKPVNVDLFIRELIIAPIELFTETELEEYKNNDLFIERKLGNAVLIATGKIP